MYSQCSSTNNDQIVKSVLGLGILMINLQKWHCTSSNQPKKPSMSFDPCTSDLGQQTGSISIVFSGPKFCYPTWLTIIDHMLNHHEVWLAKTNHNLTCICGSWWLSKIVCIDPSQFIALVWGRSCACKDPRSLWILSWPRRWGDWEWFMGPEPQIFPDQENQWLWMVDHYCGYEWLIKKTMASIYWLLWMVDQGSISGYCYSWSPFTFK